MSAQLPIATPDHWDNFLWMLNTTDIAPEYPLPWLPQTRRQALAEYFSAPGVRAQFEAPLLETLQQCTSHRLGIYFEQLWGFAFTHHPDYTLLARNLPIRAEGKTLGELDFVVRHHPDSAVEHWELALKFYLQIDEYWVGPGLKDRLDIKLQRMRDHQLPVALGDTASAILRNQGIQLDRQWALMPGRLFRPLASLPAPDPRPGDYWWADLATFRAYFPTARRDNLDTWCQLPKSCWLAPYPMRMADGVPASTEAEPELSEALLSRGPICVARTAPEGELSRGFLVPADWRVRALASIPCQT
ncbi:DUF1853 family protein [Microbulbifer agarilyticus]|uniref:DUF1853 family protein n=1 Tax=Microbulbifer agarilyticus TaxID=260552 RepID=UPI001CD33FA3|nr:DUF1853 family protein [Microbulbifer agarilyticus]MCA0892821.1 DUF1853 family protein [Microbulbifer agarilyticus]